MSCTSAINLLSECANIWCTIGSPQRDLIIKHIAPTIACMHITFPLSMSSMFSRILIEKFSVLKSIDCTDLMALDHFFDAIIQKCVMTLRYSDNECWPTIIPKLICTTAPKWKCLGGMCFTCTRLRRESSYAKFQSSRVSGCTSSLLSEISKGALQDCHIGTIFRRLPSALHPKGKSVPCKRVYF